MTSETEKLIADLREFADYPLRTRPIRLRLAADALAAAEARERELTGERDNAIGAFNASCAETDRFEAEVARLASEVELLTEALGYIAAEDEGIEYDDGDPRWEDVQKIPDAFRSPAIARAALAAGGRAAGDSE